ncbi:PepSY domain-containing protein [Olivibacter sp. SDN3]|uniref:PepSY-associated TM helix domain-containing protein n=1 Tax=Olivibacter sp. SDN3 TaxID=2764720 RepID=UPI00165118E1|nr:PepSY-associated TM helix domain-containing protein [Olivibacter sp. SDN3]QNL49617.1 PepSY domain-containing protein [Olivibacter sp. SDN3]
MARQTIKWEKIRKLLNDIHLWMGLASGLILIAVCLSGTIYVYNTELQELSSPHLYRVQQQDSSTERMPAAELIAIVKAASGGNVTSVNIPDDAARTYQISVRAADDKSRFGTSYFINPYNGEIVGTSLEKSKMADFMRDMFSLHRWLFLDRIEEPIFEGLENRKLGSYITGTATILFTLGALTGIVLWFPKKLRNWKQGLKIKWGGSWKRTNHDLHNTLGFYSFILLLLMGITGPQWSFEWYRDGLRKVLGTYEANATRGRPDGAPTGKGGANKAESEKEEVTLLPIERYLASADQTLTYKGDYRITLPKTIKEHVSLNKTKVGFFAPAAGDQLKLNTQTAALEEVSVFTDKPLNERISSSIKAIHVGNVYGSFTKLLYFIACLIATTLPVTGTLIWINKMKKKPSSKWVQKKRDIATKQRPVVASTNG